MVQSKPKPKSVWEDVTRPEYSCLLDLSRSCNSVKCLIRRVKYQCKSHFRFLFVVKYMTIIYYELFCVDLSHEIQITCIKACSSDAVFEYFLHCAANLPSHLNVFSLPFYSSSAPSGLSPPETGWHCGWAVQHRGFLHVQHHTSVLFGVHQEPEPFMEGGLRFDVSRPCG